jgi:hypothetical protein
MLLSKMLIEGILVIELHPVAELTRLVVEILVLV